MSPETLILLLTATIIFIYFSLRSGGFDINFSMLISAVTYGCGGFFLEAPERQIVFKYFSIIILAIFIFTIFSDALLKRKNKVFQVKTDYTILYTFLSLSLCLLLYRIYSNGIGAILTTKQEQYGGEWASIIYSSSATIGICLSVYYRHKNFIIIFSLMQLIIFLLGDRTNLAISLVSCAIILMNNKRPLISYLKKPYILVLSIIFGMLLIYGKDIYGAFLHSTSTNQPFIDSFKERLADNESNKGNELSQVGLLLSYSYQNQQSLDSTYLLNWPLQLLPIAPNYGFNSHHYSNYMKSTFFPSWSETAGVGGSFWGEALITGGDQMFFFYLFLYILASFFFIFSFQRTNGNIKVIYVVMAVYWCFYIHRNSLFQMLSHEKKIIYLSLIAIIISTIIKILIRTSKHYQFR